MFVKLHVTWGATCSNIVEKTSGVQQCLIECLARALDLVLLWSVADLT